MKDLFDVLQLRPDRKCSGAYGVEIEVEGKNLPTDLGEYWRVERDGSLKTAEAWEYVMPRPLDLSGVKLSLNYLEAAYAGHKSKIDDSIRAGVHVHMNVQKWNIKQLCTFIMCYYLLEDILVGWCGENRSGNLFCLRTKDAEGVLFSLIQAIEERKLRYINTDNLRYSSLNLISLFKYGSIEFRSMRGTGDLNLIYDWVKIIDNLRQGSLTFSDPLDVIASMSGEGELQFLSRALPNDHVRFNNIPNIRKSIRDAARRTQMFAYHIDWNSIGNNTNPFEQEAF